MMKRLIIKLTMFFLTLVIVDFFFGEVFKYFQTHSKGGATYRMEYIANKMKDEIVIMGSSRAIHHYDPRILQDSLGLTSFNCGLGGNGIIYNYGQYRIFKERYAPQILIYDIYDQYDLVKGLPNERYIDGLRLYYEKMGIDSVFMSVDSMERYKMLSQMRRFNGKFISVFSNFLYGHETEMNGYVPLEGRMNYEPKKNTESFGIEYDNLKLHYLRRLINESKSQGAKLIFAISPRYGGSNDSVYRLIKEIAMKEGLMFLDYYNDSTIVFNRSYFKDSGHLNEVGATVYTKKILKDIEQVLSPVDM